MIKVYKEWLKYIKNVGNILRITWLWGIPEKFYNSWTPKLVSVRNLETLVQIPVLWFYLLHNLGQITILSLNLLTIQREQ